MVLIPPARTAAVRSRDGTRLRLQLLGPDDAGAMHAFLESLTPEDRRLRFFVPVPVVAPSLVRPLVEVDPCEHVAWLGWAGTTPVVEARFARRREDRSTAELAFAVHPRWRRRGLADTAVRALGVVAGAMGVTTFAADALPDNRGSISLLRSLGMTTGFDSGWIVAHGPVPEWTGDPADAEALIALHRLEAAAHAA